MVTQAIDKTVGIQLRLLGIIGLVLIWSAHTARAESGADLAGVSAGNLISMGHQASAEGAFAKAVAVWREMVSRAEDSGTDAAALDNLIRLSGAYRSLGHYSKALAAIERAVELSERVGGREKKALALSSAADLALASGDILRAQTLAEEARGLAIGANDPATLAAVLNNLGNVYAAQRRFPAARQTYEGGAEFAEKADDNVLLVNILVNSARTAISLHDYAAAEIHLTKAVSTNNALMDGHDKAFAFNAIGLMARRLMVVTPERVADLVLVANASFKNAARIADAVGDIPTASYAYGYLGQLYEFERRYGEALNLTARALFLAQQAAAPDILYQWQWQMARLHHAFGQDDEAIEAYRRTLTTLSPLREDLASGRRDVQSSYRQVVEPIFLGLTDLLLKKAERTSDEKGRQEYLSEARDTVEFLKAAELQDYFQDDCVATFRAKVQAIDLQLDSHTAVFYPILLPDRFALLVTVQGKIQQFSVPVTPQRVLQSVRQFRERVQNPRDSLGFLKPAQELYRWLIEPVKSVLDESKITTLVIVPDGPLRTIPFSALHDGDDFLVTRYALATTPGLNLTDPRPLDRKGLTVLAAGLSDSVQGFAALPSVSSELANIESLYEGVRLQNASFTVPQIQAALSGTPFRMVHLATHAQFSSELEDTFLLTYDGKLSMDGLEDLIGLGRFREDPIELLTLSACQTAVGDDRAALGLAGIAVKAGARAALASLWFIDDLATSLLISDFYKLIQERPDLNKAEVLRKAQQNLMEQKKYAHPAFWAAFMLIGNWQ